MLKVEQISSQFWLIRYNDNGSATVISGPYSTREQAETMTKVYDL